MFWFLRVAEVGSTVQVQSRQMVPSGRTARSLVINDASAWYLTVGLACSRHLRQIHWRMAAGAPVCMRWRVLQLQVEIALLQNRACHCNVPEVPGHWGGTRGPQWEEQRDCCRVGRQPVRRPSHCHQHYPPGPLWAGITSHTRGSSSQLYCSQSPQPPTLSAWATGLWAGITSHTRGSSSQLCCSQSPQPPPG